MAKLINNKAELQKFNMGIEFEFFVKTSALKKDLIIKNPIPNEVLKKYGHLFILKNTNNSMSFDYKDAGKYFLKQLKIYYTEEDWKKIFKITEDGSLTSDESKIGVEMILNHTSADLTMNRLRKIFAILTTPDFVTTTECGLHINLSFTEVAANRKDLVFDVVSNLDINKILLDFGRQKNEYCRSNLKDTIDEYDFRDQIMEQLSKLLSAENGKKTDEYSFQTVWNTITKLKEKNNVHKFSAIIEDAAKKVFTDEWGHYDRPAVAPKKNSNQHYLEFRLTGGKNYENKIALVEDAIGNYIKSMKKANFNYQKKQALSNISKSKKMMA